jgi:hypothetical protein
MLKNIASLGDQRGRHNYMTSKIGTSAAEKRIFADMLILLGNPGKVSWEELVVYFICHDRDRIEKYEY